MNMSHSAHLPRGAFFWLSALLFVLSAPLTTLAQRDLKNIPDPDPELERKSFIVADGFEVQLFAADPRIAKPIQMNFDSQGRLWVASSGVYPHIKPGQKATDKILILEDTNRDGRADKTTVFADGLLIPTGVLPGDGGVYVANSTELVHFSDTNGDGKSDQRRVVLAGFGTEDTHHLLHTLRWGFDGALYMNQSIYIHTHLETPYGVRRLNGGGIWRFRPDTMRAEVVCEGFVNPWGNHFDYWGQEFATDGAYGEGINYVFPGAVYVTAPGAVRRLRGLNPGSPKHCGLEILSGRHLPDDWSGNMITNDFRAHRVCRFVVSEDGAGYASRQEEELIKTTHGAFRPIDVKVGPDGAIYIADWYNPIIQHGEVDFRDQRRDHTHGRIWRVTAKNRALAPWPNLPKASTAELLDYLKAPEEWTRLHAKLELKSRGAAEVAPKLRTWLKNLDVQDAAREHHRLEGLWLFQNLRVVDTPLLNELLASPDHRVRAAAMRVAVLWGEHLPDLVDRLARGVHDAHPRVRLEAVRGLAGIPTDRSAELVFQSLEYPLDRFSDFATWRALRQLQGVWLPKVKAGELYGGSVDKLTYAIKAVGDAAALAPLVAMLREGKIAPEKTGGVLQLIATTGDAAALRTALDIIVGGSSEFDDQQRARLLTNLVSASRSRKMTPTGDLAPLASLLDEKNALRTAAIQAVGVWKIQAGREQLAQWATGKLPPGKAKPSAETRGAAISALASLGGKENFDILAAVAANADDDFVQRRAAVAALSGVQPVRAAGLAVKLLQNWPQDEDPAGLFAAFLARKQGPGALIKAMAGKKLPPDTAKLALRAARSGAQSSDELLKAIQTAGGLDQAGWKLNPEQFAALLVDVAKLGDPARGEAIFRRDNMQCLKCHSIGGAGGRVGPDLLSVGASAPVDYLLESMLDPNKKIKENFHSQIVLTDEGRVITGVRVRESEKELVLRDAEDREITIPISAIEERRDGRSLMPDGQVDILTRQELIDLVRFMSEIGKVGPYAVSKDRLVRRWELLELTPAGKRRLNRTSYDTAATDDPALVWKPVYSKVSGELPTNALPQFVIHRDLDPTSFVRCQIDISTPGKVRLLVKAPAGLSWWVDEKPRVLAAENVLELSRGRHQLTFAVNQKQHAEPLRVELRDVEGSPAQAMVVGGK